MRQAREKFLSLRKGTKLDTAFVIEEELHNARSTFEEALFNLVTALSNVEAKKRFKFLEAVTGIMDAHLCYFKQGYDLLHQMEPYINQVLTYAQQSRERYEHAALTERMQEYRRHIDREIRWFSEGQHVSPNGDGIHTIGRGSHKLIEAVMQSAIKGKVQMIRQGYLSKHSSNLRGDWKRRFFVLDSRGMLYYYRKEKSKPFGGGSHLVGQRNSSEMSPGLLSRWLSSHYHGEVHDEKYVAHHTLNLLTSTIKVDVEQSDLRFCFRIILPSKNYTLHFAGYIWNALFKPRSDRYVTGKTKQIDPMYVELGIHPMVDPRALGSSTIVYRPIKPYDLEALEQIHGDLFPIRYESEFFLNVVNGRDIVSWGVVDCSHPEG
ncbi:hypothetical protein GIB67_008753 [Kingdonia uniflora]|uniref:PH domain-containing protein n=1 Tax=Kingdonia uniflora TaxID=39325 RepID=A0A7J7P698_9MAGN|nr:hypothetical protein GIB67_008753 [Kingdonia uniflora]